jgi:hypothetical protein
MHSIWSKAVCLTAAVIIVSAGNSALAQATADVVVNMSDVSGAGYYLLDYSPPTANVGPTGSGNLDPTMSLQVGTRYQFHFEDGFAHPWQVVARDASPALDVVLLAQGPTAGTFEGDSGVGWLESGNDMYFTMTQALADALSAGGKSPGYRCEFHPFDMRGAISIVPQSGIDDWEDY